VAIDWAKFKQYKTHTEPKEGQTNLSLLVGYLKDRAGLHLYDDIYEAISTDELGKTMLEKNGVESADKLMRMYFGK